jgi:hypothetical protein
MSHILVLLSSAAKVHDLRQNTVTSSQFITYKEEEKPKEEIFVCQQTTISFAGKL